MNLNIIYQHVANAKQKNYTKRTNKDVVFSRTQAKHPEGNKHCYILFHAVFLLSHEMMKI